MSLTVHDLFAGAGGSSTGAISVPGVEVVLAANHWQRAIDVHHANHPNTRHLCADISQYDPRRIPTADLLWASPECFTAGHLVLTSRGQVPIEDVRVGDTVLTHLGRWRPVVRVQSREAQTIIAKGQGHTGIETTPSHRFWVRSSRRVWRGRTEQYRREYAEPDWAAIDGAVQSESLWATPVTTEPTAVPERPEVLGFDDARAWWLIGRWVADGSLTFGRNHEVLIACGYHQADALEAELSNTGTRWARSDKRTAAVFSLGDEKARDWLHEHFGHGAANKQFPAWSLSLSIAHRSSLLDGYVSGDGHVSDRRTMISTVSKALAVSARLLAESLGHRVGMSADKRTSYRIEGRVGAAKPQWIVHWSNRRSPTRASEAFSDGTHAWSRIRSITPTGRTAIVYNIEVDEDHSYVLDGIVVKNCTNHSQAKGRRRETGIPDLFGETLPDEAAERSRATMWDVPRFTEAHHYRAVIVENVVDAYHWPPFQAWLMAMHSYGYDHQLVFLNSMHAQRYGMPAPQSRDRMYVVFWRRGDRRPDLEVMQRPQAYCPGCGGLVAAVQSWKRPERPWGRYRAQYVYRCPNHSCRGQIVEPGWLPAAAAIDWSIVGQRLGDRAKPLAEKTRARIAAGIARYWRPVHVEAAGNTYDAADPKHPAYGRPDGYYRAWPVDEPLKTLHAIESKALAVPVEGRDGKGARPIGDPLRTMTTRNETGISYPFIFERRFEYRTRSVEEPIATLTASDTSKALVIPFIAELRGGGSTARPVDHPMCTVTAAGNHHALVAPYYGTSDTARPDTDALGTLTTRDRYALIMRNNEGGAEMTTPATEYLRTLTTKGHQSIIEPGDIEAARAQVDDCLFRMLEPHEVAAGMAFPDDYVWQGTRRERVRLAGNAVTPPAARDLVGAVVEALS